MCFFPFKNTAYKSIAYKKGIHEFDCGCCPECLAKRARIWALRCSAQAQVQQGIMVTLTYDDYKYDRRGAIVGELPPNPNINLSKRHCQLFIKRLRSHFKSTDIKYLICGERGKRTNRAHYHAILFGVDFADKVYYKTSKRGNRIYKSAELTKIWGHGICTIDAININAQVARYCTKYCAKDSRADDTFMLFSRNIGDSWLLEHFNGKNYILDGREYTIPRGIWQKVIAKKYGANFVFNRCGADYRYRALKWYNEHYEFPLSQYLFDYNVKSRRNFRSFRDADRQYKQYLEYWKNKAERLNETRPSVFERIRALPDKKYFTYKQAALSVLQKRALVVEPFNAENLILPPRYISVYRKLKELDRYRICPLLPCHKRANDSLKNLNRKKRFNIFCIDQNIAVKGSLIPFNERCKCPFDT